MARLMNRNELREMNGTRRERILIQIERKQQERDRIEEELRRLEKRYAALLKDAVPKGMEI